jgi:hypothetical protein
MRHESAMNILWFREAHPGKNRRRWKSSIFRLITTANMQHIILKLLRSTLDIKRNDHCDHTDAMMREKAITMKRREDKKLCIKPSPLPGNQVCHSFLYHDYPICHGFAPPDKSNSWFRWSSPLPNVIETESGTPRERPLLPFK